MLPDPTIDTYNAHAEEFIEYFAGIGSRRDSINRAFEMCPNKQPTVLELGCGDGRDARDILTHTTDYLGTDYSVKFIEIAKRTNPGQADKFCIADMRTFFQGNTKKYDIIFAFAAILHLNRDELTVIMPQITDALSSGGLVLIITKYAEVYREDLQQDRFGRRWFYYYHPDEIAKMAIGANEIYRDVRTIGSTVWFEIILQKDAP